jgi:hypothetical protein
MANSLDREVGRSRRWTHALALVVIAALTLVVAWLLLLTE